MPNQATLQIPDKLVPVFEGESRYRGAHGGRGSAKTRTFALMTAVRGFQFAEAGIHGQVLCGREFMNSLADSSFQEVKIAIQSTPWLNDYYECGDSYIRTKNKRVHYTFAGLRHSLDSIKSKARILLAWVDEADNWRDNPWFPGVLRKEKDRDKNLLTPEMYDHIWEGGYLSVVQGAIYGAELLAAKEQGRITTVDYDPEVEVFTAWDIGHTDDTAIWWYQIVGNEIHVIECFAKSGGSLSEFATQITGIETTIDIIQGEVVVTKHGPVAALEHRQAYKYNTHWLPHDARARVLSAHGKSTQQQLRAALGWNVRITPNLSREDGIQAARTTFARCWFDKDNCLDGLKALRKYQREVQRDEVSLRQNPKHDWTSHYADAFRYLSVAWQEPILPTEEEAQQRDAYEDDDEPNDWKVA